MNKDFKNFLIQQNALFNSEAVEHFGQPQAELHSIESDTVLADISRYGLIQVSGSEAKSFLQSQFSNNVEQVTENQAQLNSYCSPKGRILANFVLFQRANDYFLHMPNSLIPSIVKRLGMYKMRADVQISDATDELPGFAIAGNDALMRLQQISAPLALQTNPYSSCTQAGLSIIVLPGPTPRYLMFAPSETIIRYWESLRKNTPSVGAGPWRLLEIRAGIPIIDSQTTDIFVPQMVNLQAVGGVSFKKGCYPGQEIVARMQYLGKLKRKMYLLHSDSSISLAEGSDLTTEHASDTQSRGKIVNAQPTPAGGMDALAVMQISSLEEGTIKSLHTPDIHFIIKELPYSLSD